MKIIVWGAMGLFVLFWYNELKMFFNYEPPKQVDTVVQNMREPIDRWMIITREDVECVTSSGESVVYKTIEHFKEVHE